MIRVCVDRASVAGRLWGMAILAATGAIAAGAMPQAHAALRYWSDDEPYYYDRLEPATPHRHAKANRHAGRQVETLRKEVETARKEQVKPQGPLVIAISIDQQRLRLYDANGLFAETPISTGMKGHPTPMGVFSVIQKQKLHHSNIYSGAPMPYMQRITWSGIAIHAGVLPGYPASHGCIRMPMAFAMKMWVWTRMGARVVVTPGGILPESFSHPLLATQKIAPPPQAGIEPVSDAPPATKSDQTDVHPGSKADELSLNLRATIGQAAPTDSAPSPGNAGARPDHGGGARSASADVIPLLAADVAEATLKSDPPKPQAAETLPGDAIKLQPIKATTGSDAKKDQTRWPDMDRPAALRPDAAGVTAPKQNGQIAVLISRKDGKLYVRQNFAPLFESAVTIAPSDRPLGTHIFTAQVDKADSNRLNWSVVSLPQAARAERRDDDARRSHRRKNLVAVENKPQPLPDSPAEALDRLTIPAETMARITEALSTGGSIIVSDQGINAGETGEGTDFIVSLR